MRTLKFLVNEQRLSKDISCNFDGLVTGTSNYLEIYVNFMTTEWKGMPKVAEFCKCGTSDDIYAALLKHDRCKVPNQMSDKKHWKMRIVGEKNGVRLITNWCAVRQGG